MISNTIIFNENKNPPLNNKVNSIHHGGFKNHWHFRKRELKSPSDRFITIDSWHTASSEPNQQLRSVSSRWAPKLRYDPSHWTKIKHRENNLTATRFHNSCIYIKNFTLITRLGDGSFFPIICRGLEWRWTLALGFSSRLLPKEVVLTMSYFLISRWIFPPTDYFKIPVLLGFPVVSAELHRTAPPAAHSVSWGSPFTVRGCECKCFWWGLRATAGSNPALRSAQSEASPSTGNWVQTCHRVSRAARWAAAELQPQTPSVSGREQQEGQINNMTISILQCVSTYKNNYWRHWSQTHAWRSHLENYSQ